MVEIESKDSLLFFFTYFPFRLSEFDQYFQRTIDMTRRMMGVVLQHKNDPQLTRKLFTHRSLDKGYFLEEHQIPYPPCKYIYNLLKYFSVNCNT